MTLARIMAASLVAGFVLVGARQGIAQNCTRADLQAAVDSYLNGQRNGSPPSLIRPAAITYVENTEPIAFEKSILKTPLKIDFSRSLLDTEICETFTEVIVTDKTHPYVIGVRLRVAGKTIGQVETLVTDAGDWLFDADNYLKYSSTENWSTIPAASRNTRSLLVAAATAYAEVFDDNKVNVPWGTPCNRLEGGRVRSGRGAADDSCNAGVPSGMKLKTLKFIADPEIGAVVAFIRWPTTVPDTHLFRVEAGKLRFVHSLTVCTVPNCGFPTAPPPPPK